DARDALWELRHPRRLLGPDRRRDGAPPAGLSFSSRLDPVGGPGGGVHPTRRVRVRRATRDDDRDAHRGRPGLGDGSTVRADRTACTARRQALSDRAAPIDSPDASGGRPGRRRARQGRTASGSRDRRGSSSVRTRGRPMRATEAGPPAVTLTLPANAVVDQPAQSPATVAPRPALTSRKIGAWARCGTPSDAMGTAPRPRSLRAAATKPGKSLYEI